MEASTALLEVEPPDLGADLKAVGLELMVRDFCRSHEIASRERRGDAAEQLYARLGYVRAGIIPRHARSASGALEDTAISYRELKSR